MNRLIHSLNFQITAAIAALSLLFAVSTVYSLHVISAQHADDALLRLVGRLQFNQQHLTVQAMRYDAHAPRDYPSYYRDLGLYFEDLKRTRAELQAAIDALASNRFPPELLGPHMAMSAPPRLPPHSQQVATELAENWNTFVAGLDERIGPDPAEPRLEWAAQWIAQHNLTLADEVERLAESLQAEVAARAASALLINRLLLGAALLVAVGIGIWFYRRVLTPLGIAVDGFRQVANGDFAHRVPIVSDNEIGWLASAFNQLSDRLDTLRRLLTGLEQGADIDATLHTLSTTLPGLIPVDWIAVLVVGSDGRMHLERAYSDGRPEPTGHLAFTPDRTLLEECLNTRAPLHIPDVHEMAASSEHYEFLRKLERLGRRDAVFLPVGNGVTQGVAVFASRFPNNFRSDHLALLGNLGVLVGASLGRTLQLVESARLAAIGQFASGIAHEIRNPLATIALALEHTAGLEGLEPGTRKRIELARDELTRLERLLGDILLYAKPTALDRRRVDVEALLSEVIASEAAGDPRIDHPTGNCPWVDADPDRLRQVFINLIRNARQAAPQSEPITITCSPDAAGWPVLCFQNGGAPVPADVLPHLFEPFVTTRSEGTGLGLAIAQRIVHAHAGEISITSSEEGGTTVHVRLPPAE